MAPTSLLLERAPRRARCLRFELPARQRRGERTAPVDAPVATPRAASSPLGRRNAPRIGFGLALFCLGAPLAAAQMPHRFLVSTTDNAVADMGPLGAFGDEGLVVLEAGAAPLPYLLEGNWRALLPFVPGDIDGLAIAPGYGTLSQGSLCFSLLSDQGGFLDGDVVRFDATGALSVYVAEATLAAALGVEGTGLDLDGIAFDGNQRLLFSLHNEVVTGALGPVMNGDVLRLDGGGSVVRILQESDVQNAYTQATGSAMTIGDVQGLEWHAGEVWVTVQSPSSADGGILRVTGTPGFVTQETELAIGGVEIDAFLRLPDWESPFSLWIEPNGVGATGHLAGGTPGGLALVLASASAGFQADPFLGGFAAWYLNPADPYLVALLSGPGASGFTLDALGRASQTFVPSLVGAGLGFAGEPGWSYQALDVGSLRLSTPFRITF